MKTLRRILRYVKKNIWLMVLSMILAVGASVSALFIPILIGNAIDSIADVVGKTNGNEPVWIIIREALVKTGILVCVSALCQQLMSMLNNKVTYRVVGDIRKEAFDKIQKLPLKYLDAHPAGGIVSNMISDVEQFADGLLLGFSQLFTGVITIVGTLILMLSINVRVALLVLVLTPMSFGVARFISKHTYDMFKLQSETRGEQTTLIDEVIGNEKVVKSFCHEDESIEKFDEINARLKDCSLKAVFYSSLTNPCTRFVNALVYAVVALAGGFSVINGALTVGMLSTLLCYANQYTKPFNEITGVITELQNALACADRIFAFLDEDIEKDSKVLDDANNKEDEKNIQGHVIIKDVDFSYDPERPLIEDLNLEVKPGQNVAIVGPTGCGKTTLINLLMRFYDINDGEIVIDGKEIRSMRRHELRSRFGMVLQDTWIKEGTVLENIMIGKEGASREEAIEAAKKVHAHSFIKRLPKGYDTVLDEEGGGLSTGQKQLLCIARVMLMQPPMLILDEATSNIDTRTELMISRAFNKLMENRTSFVVAHRLSTIKNADIILVMKDGHIIEQGDHASLLAKGGFYKQLYMSQYANI
ncbi:MAG: ABC transporter ATP-binding protein [Lachnospiraceae bacterium]|nr:ABC transporter ATP-binding protein [Lachnospiraceae bacterium]